MKLTSSRKFHIRQTEISNVNYIKTLTLSILGGFRISTTVDRPILVGDNVE